MPAPSSSPGGRAEGAGRPRVLVTGATRGIGRAIAGALAPSHHVLIGGRDPGVVSQVVAELPSASPFVVDLRDEVSTEAAASEIDTLDALVHCAGIVPARTGSLRSVWREVLEVNVVAVAHLTALCLPMLRRSHGQVVFINSGSGLHAWGDTSGYSASKFALTSFADGLRESERGAVRVSSIHPGRVDTDMQRDLQGRLGRKYDASEHLTAESVARAVRAVIDAADGAVIESLSIRPEGNRRA